MKTLFTIILIFMSTVCWGTEPKEFKEFKVKVGDGYVICIGELYWNTITKTISCNWEAYNKRQEKKKGN